MRFCEFVILFLIEGLLRGLERDRLDSRDRDGPRCFVCQRSGHLAKHCPKSATINSCYNCGESGIVIVNNLIRPVLILRTFGERLYKRRNWQVVLHLQRPGAYFDKLSEITCEAVL